MNKSNFSNNGIKYIIQYESEDTMKEIIDKFLSKSKKNNNNLSLIYNGKIIKEKQIFNKSINNEGINSIQIFDVEGNIPDDDLMKLGVDINTTNESITFSQKITFYIYQYSIKNMNIKKNKTLLFYMHFLFFLLFFCFLVSCEKEKINLVSIGTGDHFILSSEFYIDPSEIIINEITKMECKKNCNFNEEINNVTIKFNNKIESFEKMFNGLTNIIEIDLSGLDTSNVLNMGYMFNDCTNLEKIIFGNINTSSVKDMNHLFSNCQKLTTINLSNFDTSSVTNMHGMFLHCDIIISLDVSKFDTRNVEIMQEMFAYCNKLTSINVSNFITSKVTNAWQYSIVVLI